MSDESVKRILHKEIGRAKFIKDYQLCDALRIAFKSIDRCKAYKEKITELEYRYIELVAEFETYKRGQKDGQDSET